MKNGPKEHAKIAPGADTEFRSLLGRVSEGSEEAAWEIIEEYGDAIFRAVRRALNSRMRQRFDSADFVQLVWASFFRKRGGLDRFATPGELAAFFVGMAQNKVAMEARRCLIRPKSNMNRERSLDDPRTGIKAVLESPTPGPLDVAVAKEQYDRFLDDQPEHYRKIIHLKLAGHTQRDIAARLGVADCTVRRFLKKLCLEISE